MSLGREKVDHVADDLVDVRRGRMHLGAVDVSQEAVEYLFEPVRFLLNDRNFADRPSAALVGVLPPRARRLAVLRPSQILSNQLQIHFNTRERVFNLVREAACELAQLRELLQIVVAASLQAR